MRKRFFRAPKRLAARRRTKHTPTASRVGGQVKAELVAVGQSGEQTWRALRARAIVRPVDWKAIGRQGELLRTGIRMLGGALAGVATVGGLAALVDRSLSAADASARPQARSGFAWRRCRSCALLHLSRG